MRKICIALNKGGVAKSSTAVSLAAGLSKRKKRVLLIDTDDQDQDSILLGVEYFHGLDEVLMEKISAKEAINQVDNNLFLMPSGYDLSKAKREVGKKAFRSEETLKEALNEIVNEFDYIIVDTAPSFDSLTINALFFCEEVITPVSLEALSLASLKDFLEKIERIREYHPLLEHTLILPTFYDQRVNKSEEIMKILKKYYPEKMCDPIRYNVRLSECAGFGTSIFDFAPNSKGALDYDKFVKKVMKNGKKKNS